MCCTLWGLQRVRHDWTTIIIQQDWSSYRERDTKEWECPASLEESSHQKQNPPDLRLSSLQNSETINLSCLSHAVHVILLWRPEQTNIIFFFFFVTQNCFSSASSCQFKSSHSTWLMHVAISQVWVPCFLFFFYTVSSHPYSVSVINDILVISIFLSTKPKAALQKYLCIT